MTKRSRNYRTTIPVSKPMDMQFMLPGGILAAILVLGYRVVFGGWMDVPASLLCLVISLGCSYAQAQRVKTPRETTEDRMVLLRERHNVQTRTDQEKRDGQFMWFIRHCLKDNTLRYWESKLGRDKYAEFRDILISGGYAEWVNGEDHRRGWRVTASVAQIEEALDLGGE